MVEPQAPTVNHEVVVLDIPDAKAVTPFLALLMAGAQRLQPTVYYGSGWGGIVALLLSCGYRPAELIEITDLWVDEPRNSVGYNARLLEKLEELVRRKLVQVPSLAGLYQATGSQLVTAYYNLTAGELTFLHHQSTPTLSCVTAVILGMLDPPQGRGSMYRGQVITGAATVDRYPLWYFKAAYPEAILVLTPLSSTDESDYQTQLNQYRCRQAYNQADVITVSPRIHQAFNQGLDYSEGIIEYSTAAVVEHFTG